jgi:Protein of unknown function (DUF2281)
MSVTELIAQKVSSLPNEKQTEVLDFVEFLEQKEQAASNVKLNQPRQFGSAKGMIRIAKDFDEPLEDFEEYMR